MTIDADPIITPQDARDAGHCALGIRRWMEHYGIDPKRFFSGQVHASEMVATGDANGLAVVAFKKAKLEAEEGTTNGVD